MGATLAVLVSLEAHLAVEVFARLPMRAEADERQKADRLLAQLGVWAGVPDLARAVGVLLTLAD